MAVGRSENESTASPAVKVLETHRVSPPPSSVPDTVLPLTFYDVLWLFMGPVERLFFYHSTNIATLHDFLRNHLPALRHSLSLTLQSYFSLAGHLVPSTETGELVISYADGDSVSFVVTESDADFAALISDSSKDVRMMHPLVPSLPAADEMGRSPICAVQVTIFPGAGFCLGVSIHHAAADGNSSTRFLKAWAAIHRSVGDPSALPAGPVYDRGVLGELDEHKMGFLQDLQRVGPELEASLAELVPKMIQLGPLVRTTFILTRAQIEKLQVRIASVMGDRPSTFVAACSHVWVCLTKARGDHYRTVYMSFAGDCRRRLDPPMPAAYFGNCIGGVYCEASGAELVEDMKGIIAASKALRSGIEGLQSRPVVGLREMVHKFVKLVNERVLSIAGSPRLGVYEIDFGWGVPKKVEVKSIEGNGAMSLAESRDGEGGIEIGMVGPKSEIENFGIFFKEDL